MGKKIIHFLMRRDVLRGRKSKAGGKIIKGFGEREGKGRRKKREKKKIWGKYNFWQYQIIKLD